MLKKLNNLGYTKVELLIVVVLIGIVSFIMINKTSYAFAKDNVKELNEVKNLIALQAEDYANEHLDIFDETNTTFVSVNELVENGYLIANKDGLVKNPIEENKSLNDLKIKLEYRDNEVKATIVD